MSQDYARTSPIRLCLLYLEQAAHEAERAVQDPPRWFIAAPEMHRALNCALVAVLSGSEGVGAYSEKIRLQWVAHFQRPNWPDLPEPSNDRVQSFTDLLARAQDPDDPWIRGRPIKLTTAQLSDLARLTKLRDNMEHVKPRGWSIEVSGLPRILAAAAEAMAQLLQEALCRTELEEEEAARFDRSIAQIRKLERQHRPGDHLSNQSEQGQ